MVNSSPLSFILVKPQLGENIGAAARVMRNFGHTDLRLVAPRDGWPNPHALPMSAGAFDAGVNVQVFDTTEAALTDLQLAFATTARRRGIEKPVYTLEAAQFRAQSIPATKPDGHHGDDGHDGSGGTGGQKQPTPQTKIGLLFGPENSGLDNSDVSLCDGIITYPVDASFQSLNLAQAVGVAAYGWTAAQNIAPAGNPEIAANIATKNITDMPRPADKKDLYHLFDHLEAELDSAGFFFPGDKRTLMMNNLKNAMARAGWTTQEVQTFRGVIKALSKGRGQQTRKDNDQ